MGSSARRCNASRRTSDSQHPLSRASHWSYLVFQRPVEVLIDKAVHLSHIAAKLEDPTSRGSSALTRGASFSLLAMAHRVPFGKHESSRPLRHQYLSRHT